MARTLRERIRRLSVACRAKAADPERAILLRLTDEELLHVARTGSLPTGCDLREVLQRHPQPDVTPCVRAIVRGMSDEALRRLAGLSG